LPPEELPDAPQLRPHESHNRTAATNKGDAFGCFVEVKASANTPAPNPTKPRGRFVLADVFAVVVIVTPAVPLAALVKSTVYGFRESEDWIKQLALGAFVLQAR